MHDRETLGHLGRMIEQQVGRGLDATEEHVEVLDGRLGAIAGRDAIVADDGCRAWKPAKSSS